jgi:hypothetical protein
MIMFAFVGKQEVQLKFIYLPVVMDVTTCSPPSFSNMLESKIQVHTCRTDCTLVPDSHRGPPTYHSSTAVESVHKTSLTPTAS